MNILYCISTAPMNFKLNLNFFCHRSLGCSASTALRHRADNAAYLVRTVPLYAPCVQERVMYTLKLQLHAKSYIQGLDLHSIVIAPILVTADHKNLISDVGGLWLRLARDPAHCTRLGQIYCSRKSHLSCKPVLCVHLQYFDV